MSASRLTTTRFMLAIGSILLLLAAVAPVAGSCDPGYYTYSTSNGMCCPEGFPYVYGGSCHQCDYGSVYDSYSGTCCPGDSPHYYDGTCHACRDGYKQTSMSSGHCCPEGYPYYYDGTCHQCDYGSVYDSYSGYCCSGDTPNYYDGSCHTCRYGFKQYSTSDGHCCPEGYPYYYDGTCHSMSEVESSGTGVSIPAVTSIPAVFSATPTPAPEPVVVIVNVPASPTQTPLPPFIPVLGIGVLCVVLGIARKNR
ncbi:hypothetical protein [Methanoregula sp.]|uniref:hypothetical protein n=1 Tax=Methanoregula sp. TaxID=2052170 RepID=UPI00356318D3